MTQYIKGNYETRQNKRLKQSSSKNWRANNRQK